MWYFLNRKFDFRNPDLVTLILFKKSGIEAPKGINVENNKNLNKKMAAFLLVDVLDFDVFVNVDTFI